jgi:hypothetical protein
MLSVIALSSCEMNKSVKADLATGLSSKGDGLSCNDVFLTANDEKINRNEFVYGEKFELNFNNIEGFKEVSGGVFPGMKLLVIGKQGDTILYNADLYANLTDPTTIKPLQLNTSITIGNPFRSNSSYKAIVHIWDKKGKGTFDTEFEFNTVANKSVQITANGITANEIFLFNGERNAIVTSGKIPFETEITLVFDELQGYKSEDGQSELGMSMVIKDKNQEILLSEMDLLKEQKMNVMEQNKQLYGSFILPKDVKGPVLLEVVVWDKLGEGRIKVLAKLELE